MATDSGRSISRMRLVRRSISYKLAIMGDDGFALLGIVAWFASMIAPFATARLCWLIAVRRPSIAWVFHIAFAVLTVAVEWDLVWLIFYAAHDDGEGPPGLGLLILPPFAGMLVALCAYYLVVLFSVWRKQRDRWSSR